MHNPTVEETIECCPLCQHDEFFISADKEKFFCAQCGFHTNTLTSIQPMLAAKANHLGNRFVHFGVKTRQ
ncbi:transcription initiation factor TFIIIB [Vibrio metoecus]|uniref:transcription initiation factor TFIIIB n=1 Tax=Vibrio metoecus TaxID=1481663 RepID=UPI0009BDFC7A|nr:transcription initiation factor TFIIIB [Vibrio metoecus]PAR32601.1 transcription initiation factor TFIIIB [Vibrio metoecus]PAR47731.1 transcription initiation factor TFIIIB [Vibrio metoecus]PAR52706.1 transcription initiation factor TFIIIB [Vibrio metoecus]